MGKLKAKYHSNQNDQKVSGKLKLKIKKSVSPNNYQSYKQNAVQSSEMKSKVSVGIKSQVTDQSSGNESSSNPAKTRLTAMNIASFTDKAIKTHEDREESPFNQPT